MKSGKFVKQETKELNESLRTISQAYKSHRISREAYIMQTIKAYHEFVFQINNHIK